MEEKQRDARRLEKQLKRLEARSVMTPWQAYRAPAAALIPSTLVFSIAVSTAAHGGSDWWNGVATVAAIVSLHSVARILSYRYVNLELKIWVTQKRLEQAMNAVTAAQTL